MAELDAQTQATSQLVRNEASKRLMNALQLFILGTRSNEVISAMNTNYIVTIVHNGENQMPRWSRSEIQWEFSNGTQTKLCACSKSSCTYPATFYAQTDNENGNDHRIFGPAHYESLSPMPGFVGACTALEAILEAKLMCLYNTDCITTLTKYFPQLTEVRVILTMCVEDASCFR